MRLRKQIAIKFITKTHWDGPKKWKAHNVGQNLLRAQINVGNVHGSSLLRSLRMGAPLIVHTERLNAPCQVYDVRSIRHAQSINTLYDSVILSCVGMG